MGASRVWVGPPVRHPRPLGIFLSLCFFNLHLKLSWFLHHLGTPSLLFWIISNLLEGAFRLELCLLSHLEISFVNLEIQILERLGFSSLVTGKRNLQIWICSAIVGPHPLLSVHGNPCPVRVSFLHFLSFLFFFSFLFSHALSLSVCPFSMTIPYKDKTSNSMTIN